MRKYRDLGNALAVSRKGRGIRQYIMAKHIGCDATTLSAWEHGRALPKREYWRSIKLLLGVDVGDYAQDMVEEPSSTWVYLEDGTRVVHITFRRIVDTLRYKGYYSYVFDDPHEFLDCAARVLVGMELNRKNHRDPLEIPFEIPRNPGSRYRRFMYMRDGKTNVVLDPFDYDWESYLHKNGVTAKIVLHEDDEDKDFFKKGATVC